MHRRTTPLPWVAWAAAAAIAFSKPIAADGPPGGSTPPPGIVHTEETSSADASAPPGTPASVAEASPPELPESPAGSHSLTAAAPSESPPSTAHENARKPARTLHPLSGLGSSLHAGFLGRAALWHAAGIAATPALILTGADTRTHNLFVRNSQIDPYTTPGIYGGYFGPVGLGAGLAAWGLLGGQRREYVASCAVLQSSLVSLSWQILLKAGTGRRHPEKREYGDDGASRGFRFGLLRGGIDWGWPSGLLMSNTAAAVSLAHVYPQSRLVRAGGGMWLGYLVFSALGHETASLGWLSDAAAGTLMGYAIGQGVGRTFAPEAREASSPGILDRVSLTPVLGREHGLRLSLAL